MVRKEDRADWRDAEKWLGSCTKLSKIQVEYIGVIKCQKCLISYLARNASTFTFP